LASGVGMRTLTLNDCSDQALLELKLALVREEREKIREEKERAENAWEIERQRLQTGIGKNAGSINSGVRDDIFRIFLRMSENEPLVFFSAYEITLTLNGVPRADWTKPRIVSVCMPVMVSVGVSKSVISMLLRILMTSLYCPSSACTCSLFGVTVLSSFVLPLSAIPSLAARVIAPSRDFKIAQDADRRLDSFRTRASAGSIEYRIVDGLLYKRTMPGNTTTNGVCFGTSRDIQKRDNSVCSLQPDGSTLRGAQNGATND